MKIFVVSIKDFLDMTACRVEPSPMSNNQFSLPEEEKEEEKQEKSSQAGRQWNGARPKRWGETNKQSRKGGTKGRKGKVRWGGLVCGYDTLTLSNVRVCTDASQYAISRNRIEQGPAFCCQSLVTPGAPHLPKAATWIPAG